MYINGHQTNSIVMFLRCLQDFELITYLMQHQDSLPEHGLDSHEPENEGSSFLAIDDCLLLSESIVPSLLYVSRTFLATSVRRLV